MNVTAIGNLFGAPQKLEKTAPKPAETAGSLANNVGGSFCAMA